MLEWKEGRKVVLVKQKDQYKVRLNVSVTM